MENVKNNAILFVDDEKLILNSLERGLLDEPYKKYFAKSAQEALDILEKKDIHVLVTDMKMPGMNGLELLKIVKEKYPQIVKIVLSGYTQLPQILATINQVDIFKFITKPWKLEDEFKRVINQAIEYYNLENEKKELQEQLRIKNVLNEKLLKFTKEKSKCAKKDIHDIKIISSCIFKELKTGRENDERIQIIEDIYYRYLNVFPSIKGDFTSERLCHDINNFLSKAGIKYDLMMEIGEELGDNLQGNYGLLYIAIISLIKYSVNNNVTNQLKIAITEKMHANRRFLLCKIEILPQSNKEEDNDNIRVNTVHSIVNNICETMEGKVEKEKLSPGIRFHLQYLI